MTKKITIINGCSKFAILKVFKFREPLVRVMIEGEDQEYITKKAKEIADLIEEKLK